MCVSKSLQGQLSNSYLNQNAGRREPQSESSRCRDHVLCIWASPSKRPRKEGLAEGMEAGQTGVRGAMANILLFPRGGSQGTVAGVETTDAQIEGKPVHLPMVIIIKPRPHLEKCSRPSLPIQKYNFNPVANINTICNTKLQYLAY